MGPLEFRKQMCTGIYKDSRGAIVGPLWSQQAQPEYLQTTGKRRNRVYNVFNKYNTYCTTVYFFMSEVVTRGFEVLRKAIGTESHDPSS